MAHRIVLIDDHAEFRARARALLVGAGYDVVGEAGDGASGVRRTHELVPAAVLLDIQLPDIDGFEVIRRINAAPNPPVIVLISSRQAADYGGRIDRCGAAGFIWKAELSGAALSAILARDQT